ncbi:MAG: hypothetical protein HY940_02850 [Gammaproteobacteria bacterium]|nr:hypothetical protein [Gammaproteobacteria bacterium]
MKKFAIVLASIVTPALVYAEPVYLDCYTESQREKEIFSVKLDEDSGKITHTAENGSAFNAEGFFSATTTCKIDYQVRN